MGTIFLIAAVVGGTILVCQFILSLLGLGDHMGADVAHHLGGGFHGGIHPGGELHGDHPGDTHPESEEHASSVHLFAVISFRTLVAAAAFFGATGKAALSAGYAPSTSLILATIVGVFAMYGMYWLMHLIGSFDSYGNERISNSVGCRATVYIPIPAQRTGAGKVQLSMQNRIVEYQAVTDDPETLKTGEIVEVIGVADGDTVQVGRVAAAIQEHEAVRI